MGHPEGQPRAPATQRLCPSTLRGTCTQWATTGAPDAFRGATSAHRGSGTQGANPGAPAAERRCSSAPRGSSSQWATAGAPEAPCEKEWWARQEKEPPTKPGWAEPRTTARSWYSVNTMRSRARGAHAHRNTERQVVDGLRTEVRGQQKQSNDPHNNQHNPSTSTTGHR